MVVLKRRVFGLQKIVSDLVLYFVLGSGCWSESPVISPLNQYRIKVIQPEEAHIQLQRRFYCLAAHSCGRISAALSVVLS